MAKKYTYGNVSFGSFLAKEQWILEMNIRSLEYLMDHAKPKGQGAIDILKATIKSMKAQERRIRKQLIKKGYIKIK